MKWNTIIKVIDYLVTVILFTILLFTIMLLIYFKGSDNASIFGYQVKTVLSGSMEPSIQTGSIIIVKTVKEMEKFETNDVVTFITNENIPITHRIMKVENDGKKYITKGDANDGNDIEPVLVDNIIGEYTGVTVPYVGYTLNFVSSKRGIALLLIIPGLFFVARSGLIMWRLFFYKVQDKKI